MSELSRIEQMLIEMNNKVDGIKEAMATKEDLVALEEVVAKHSDVMAMSETLESIAQTSASKVEDKAEAGYVVLESLFKGLEGRMDQRFDKLEAVIVEGFKQTADRFSQISDIMRYWVRNQRERDREFEVVKNELEQLKKEVDKLRGEQS